MKKMNEKGFSLVELLAVVAIMGILFGIAVQAYSSYIHRSRNQGYFTLVQSAETAMNNYLFDHSSSKCAYIATLYKEQYLERPTDPGNKVKPCEGYVMLAGSEEENLAESEEENSETGKLDSNEFTTILCCTNYYYEFTQNHKVKNKLNVDTCPSPPISNCD